MIRRCDLPPNHRRPHSSSLEPQPAAPAQSQGDPSSNERHAADRCGRPKELAEPVPLGREAQPIYAAAEERDAAGKRIARDRDSLARWLCRRHEERKRVQQLVRGCCLPRAELVGTQTALEGVRAECAVWVKAGAGMQRSGGAKRNKRQPERCTEGRAVLVSMPCSNHPCAWLDTIHTYPNATDAAPDRQANEWKNATPGMVVITV